MSYCFFFNIRKIRPLRASLLLCDFYNHPPYMLACLRCCVPIPRYWHISTDYTACSLLTDFYWSCNRNPGLLAQIPFNLLGACSTSGMNCNNAKTGMKDAKTKNVLFHRFHLCFLCIFSTICVIAVHSWKTLRILNIADL